MDNVLCFSAVFGGASTLRGNRSLHSDSVGCFAGPECSPPIVLSKFPPLAVVGSASTRMVFPLQYTVVNYCTGSLLAPDVTMTARLRCAGGLYMLWLGLVPGLNGVPGVRKVIEVREEAVVM